MTHVNSGRPPSVRTQLERGQLDLFQFDTSPETMHYNKRTHGEYVRALRRTVEERERDGTLKVSDSATIALAVAGMRALEGHEARGETYGPSKILGPLVEVLRDLAPAAEDGTPTSEFDRLLEALASNDEDEGTADHARNAVPTVRDQA